MPNKYCTIITTKGSGKINAGIFDGPKVNITHAAVGNGGGAYYQPTEDQEGLVGEWWRGKIVSAVRNPTTTNMYDVKFIVPADVEGDIREMSLIDDEGDTIAICNTPHIEKTAITQGALGQFTGIMHIIVKDASVVTFTVDPSLDTVSREELNQALADHNADPEAHADLREGILDELPECIPVSEKGTDGGVAALKAIATRVRDPAKPTYGLGGGGEDGTASVALLTGDHTGDAEVSVVVDGQEYNAENMSAQAETAPNGTLILTKMEE